MSNIKHLKGTSSQDCLELLDIPWIYISLNIHTDSVSWQNMTELNLIQKYLRGQQFLSDLPNSVLISLPVVPQILGDFNIVKNSLNFVICQYASSCVTINVRRYKCD